MPLIQAKLVKGVFGATEKEAIIERLTDAMVSVEGEAMRPVTWITIEEVASGGWGVAGKAMRTSDILSMRSAAHHAERPTVRGAGAANVRPRQASAVRTRRRAQRTAVDVDASIARAASRVPADGTTYGD